MAAFIGVPDLACKGFESKTWWLVSALENVFFYLEHYVGVVASGEVSDALGCACF